jgi:energy-coupling factor transporter ATP-binding protein EcfA2
MRMPDVANDTDRRQKTAPPVECLYPIAVQSPPNSACPPFSGELRRVNVLMGANGSGKSQLLNRLAGESEHLFGAEYTPVLIEGGRVMNMPPDVGLSQRTMEVYANPTAARTNYRTTRRGTLAGRMQRTFVMLRALETEQKSTHSDAVHAWVLAGKVGPMPLRDTPPLERLKQLFNDVFPAMHLDLTEAHQLYVKRGAAHYPITNMSDGEKQVLLILAEVVILTNERSVFLVDEPELNLHPALAESLWSSVEQAYPDDVFIYATHSLPFAMRGGVETLHILGYGKVDTNTLWEGAADLKPFLGALPGIIRAKLSLAVEGDETSFDSPFYKWLLGTKDINIVPAGSSTDVIAAANRQGLWRQISTDVKLRGVIDRDFRTTAQASPNVEILEYHEAESYL